MTLSVDPQINASTESARLTPHSQLFMKLFGPGRKLVTDFSGSNDKHGATGWEESR